MPALRRTAIAMTALVVAGSLGGCGTPRVDPTTATSAASETIPPTPSANGFISSILGTRTTGSATLAVTLRTVVDGTERSLDGAGPAALNPGYADLTWTSDDTDTRVLVTGKGTFVQVEPPDGMWTELADGDTTPTSGLSDPLRDLGAMSDVVEEGRETIDGTPATRYTGTVPAASSTLRTMGLSDEELTAVGDAWQGTRVAITVWIDDAKRVIRVDRLLDLGPEGSVDASAFSSTRLSGFGDAIDLSSPPSESVVAAPEGQ